jgi:hypothetical protein
MLFTALLISATPTTSVISSAPPLCIDSLDLPSFSSLPFGYENPDG